MSSKVQSGRILFLTHGGSTIGGGHISRCFALGEAFEELGASVFWLVNSEGAALLREKGVSGCSIAEVEDPFSSPLSIIMPVVEQFSPSLCLIDSYAHTPDFLAALRRKYLLAIIDDERLRPVEGECDFVLNYNLGAEKIGYIPGRAELLLGPRYTLLRREFRNLVPEKGDSILIIPGASDLLNVGERLAEWWRGDWPHADLILGPLVEQSKVEYLSDAADAMSNFSVFHNPPDLPVRMARARAVLCTSSVTAYEALVLHKPLIVFQTAENQARIGLEIEQRGLGTNLGSWGAWNENALKKALVNPQSSHIITVNQFGAQSFAKKMLDKITAKKRRMF